MDREPDPDHRPDGTEPSPPAGSPSDESMLPPPEGTLPGERRIPPPRPRRGLLIAIGVVVLVLIAAGTWAFVALRGTEDVLVQVVPGDASVYLTAYLDPSAGQKLAVRSLLEKFPQTEDQQQVDDVLDQAINDGLGDFGLESEDIRVWIGSQVGVAVWITADAEPSIAFLAVTKDEDAAQRSLIKIRAAAEDAGVTWEDEEHEGVTIAVDRSGIFDAEQAYALVEDTVVFANSSEAVRRIIDTGRGVRASLETSAAFTASTDPLSEDRLGLLYVNAGSLVEEFASVLPTGTAGADAIPFADALIGVGGTLTAHSDGVAAEFHVAIDQSQLTQEERATLGVAHENETLAFTPQDAFGLINFSGFDQTLPPQLDAVRGLDPTFDEIDQQLGISEIVEHLSGDVGLEVGPSELGPVEGAVLIGTDDDEAMQAFLDRLSTFIVQEVAGPIPPEFVVERTTEKYQDTTITTYQVPGLASLGVAPAYAVSDGMAIVASFPQEVRDILDAKSGGDDIRSAPRYRQVIGRLDDPNITLQYLDVGAIVQAIGDALPPSEQQQFDAEVGQNIEPLKGFGATVLADNRLISLRLFVLIE
jgi:Protein of unknown function (DUF3352)